MQLHTFFAHKQGIKEAMQETLTMSKALGRPLKDYCITYEHRRVEIKESVEEEELLNLLDKINDLRAIPHAIISMSGETTNSGRYDWFSKVIYTATIPKIRQAIEDIQVEKAMKDLLKKKMGISKHKDIKCEVMALYKRGLIDWDEVVDIHHKECEL